MTHLSDEELRSLHEEMGRISGSGTGLGGAPAAAFARGRSSADVARARMDEAAPSLVAALEDTLSARTHRPWTLRQVAVRVETAADIVMAVQAPLLGVCPQTALVIVDQETARRLVTLLLGLDGAEDSGGAMGALDFHAIGRMLRGVTDDVAAALGAFLGGHPGGNPARPATVEHGWRTGARHLGAAAATLAVELEQPIQGRVLVAVPLARLERRAAVAGAPDTVEAGEQPMRAHLADVEVQLAVELGSVSMPLGALADLAQGTILPLSTTEATPLPVFVEGVRRFSCTPQAAADRRVVVTLLEPEAP